MPRNYGSQITKDDVLRPLHALIKTHVLGAERLHGEDTTVPILANGKTETGRLWVYVRYDKPSAARCRLRLSSTPPVTEDSISRSQARSHYRITVLEPREESFSNWPISTQMPLRLLGLD